jgi:hypothetical protein
MRNVVDRLAVTLSLDPGAFGSPGAAEPAATAHVPLAAAGGRISSRAVSLFRPWIWTVGGALSAAAAGGGIHAAFWPRDARVVYVEASSAMPTPAPTSLPTAVEDQPSEPSVEPTSTPWPAPRRSVSPSPAPPIGGDAALARERTLLDAARRKLAAGEAEASLSELGRHGRAFPEGKLAEEREALLINALVSVGRYEEARQKAEAFRRRYPHSFLSPSVDAAISAIP